MEFPFNQTVYVKAISQQRGLAPGSSSRLEVTHMCSERVSQKRIPPIQNRLKDLVHMSICLSACETWTMTADIKRRIQALEMKCFCKLLSICYRDHITNEVVKIRIGNTIGPYEDLLLSVKRCKGKWYGYVTWSFGLAKTILHGTVQGGRRKGRQRKRWEDNINEWPWLKHHTS